MSWLSEITIPLSRRSRCMLRVDLLWSARAGSFASVLQIAELRAHLWRHVMRWNQHQDRQLWIVLRTYWSLVAKRIFVFAERTYSRDFWKARCNRWSHQDSPCWSSRRGSKRSICDLLSISTMYQVTGVDTIQPMDWDTSCSRRRRSACFRLINMVLMIPCLVSILLHTLALT
jgi:hypothetical protein